MKHFLLCDSFEQSHFFPGVWKCQIVSGHDSNIRKVTFGSEFIWIYPIWPQIQRLSTIFTNMLSRSQNMCGKQKSKLQFSFKINITIYCIIRAWFTIFKFFCRAVCWLPTECIYWQQISDYNSLINFVFIMRRLSIISLILLETGYLNKAILSLRLPFIFASLKSNFLINIQHR